jgi:hypothetical protein
MQKKDLTSKAIQKAIKRFSDPKVNTEVWAASNPGMAKKIIELLPGVSDLVENGSEAGKAVLDLLQKEETLNDDRLSAISLYILQRFPTEEVKRVLARQISLRRFTGFNSQLAAEAFLTSAGIEVRNEDAIAVALREAKKLVAEKPVVARSEK